MLKRRRLKCGTRYKFVAKDLLRKANAKSAKQAKQKAAARRKIKTIAGKLVRELRRKLDDERAEKYGERLAIFEKVINQKAGEQR